MLQLQGDAYIRVLLLGCRGCRAAEDAWDGTASYCSRQELETGRQGARLTGASVDALHGLSCMAQASGRAHVWALNYSRLSANAKG